MLLSELSKDEVDSIVRHNYGVTLSPTFITGIYSQTKGNPLALSEVANTLLSQAGPQSSKVKEAQSRLGLPDSVVEPRRCAAHGLLT